MVIETQNLTKYYGSKVGCKDVSISVEKGEIFAFLGPNGAGKSTFIKMLTGLIFPSSGTGYLLGKPIGDTGIRRRMGYLPENFKYQDWMTGLDLLSFHASLYKLDKKYAAGRVEEVLNLVRLKGIEKFRIGTYSKGMQQRIGLAGAILSDPDLIFLDEPTSALDPIGRKEVREILMQLKEQGKTILLNSHLLSEVEMVCDSIAIIKNGTIVRCGKMADILDSKLTLEIHAENINNEILKYLSLLDSGLSFKNNRIHMVINNKENIHNIASFIIEKGGKLYQLTPKRESLENVFISLIEREESL